MNKAEIQALKDESTLEKIKHTAKILDRLRKYEVFREGFKEGVDYTKKLLSHKR